jgi:hypothetical protein
MRDASYPLDSLDRTGPVSNVDGVDDLDDDVGDVDVVDDEVMCVGSSSLRKNLAGNFRNTCYIMG